MPDSPGDPILPTRIYDVAVPPNIDWFLPQTKTVQIPDNTATGTYYLIMKIEAENQQPEYNEDNNTVAKALTVGERTSRWFEAYNALGLKSHEVAALRLYRDQILKSSWMGRTLTKWLYANAAEALTVLAGDADFMICLKSSSEERSSSASSLHRQRRIMIGHFRRARCAEPARQATKRLRAARRPEPFYLWEPSGRRRAPTGC